MRPVADKPGAARVRRLGEGLAEIASEAAVAGLLLFAIDALAHRKLSVVGFVVLLAGWLAGLVAGRAARGRGALLSAALEVLVPLAVAAVASPALKHAWSLPQILHAGGLIAAAWWIWRWRLAASGVSARAGERLRHLLVGAGALASVAPFLTDLQVGGRDAAWYSSVFIDFTGQLRAGVFPVFLGQGELSFNGSANLFRSAPLCLWLGGVADWLTWQTLSPIALRNLAVLLAALGAAGSVYAVVIRLAADGAEARVRWIAAAAALLYVTCPGVLMVLHYFELQMTYTALMALPWVIYGNVLTLRGENRGYAWLAGALALTWLAHGPLAIIALAASGVVQAGRAAFNDGPVGPILRAAAGGGILFVLCSAYYFAGMTELHGLGTPDLPREAGILGGTMLLFVSAVRLVRGCGWGWAAGWAAGLGLVGFGSPVWLAWAVIWSVLWLASAGWRRPKGTGARAGRMVLLAVATMLVAAALALLWVRHRGLVPDEGFTRELQSNVAARGNSLSPLDPDLRKYGNSQLGYGLLLLAAAGLLAAWRGRRLEDALWAGVSAFLLALVLGLPGTADFVVGYAPPYSGMMVNVPMLYRLVPPLAAISAVAGALALVSFSAGGRIARLGVPVLALAAVAWSGLEAAKVVRGGFERVNARTTTEQIFSPDRYSLGRYPYNMLKRPPHFSDGKQYPWMGTRLLTRTQDLIVGPDALARIMEPANGAEFALRSRRHEDYDDWLRLDPEFDVEPGETVLMRFEFAPGFDPTGWLTATSHRSYQEHYLDPLNEFFGFGAGKDCSRTIAFANTSPHTEHYRLQVKPAGANNLPRDGGAWGRVHLSKLDPELSPVRIRGLLPFRAAVTMPEPGFLETPRQWIRGYRAVVDGRPVEPLELKSGMLGVPLPAGPHEVEVVFVGSARLWVALGVSTLTWLALLTSPWWRDSRRLSELKAAAARWRQADPS